MRSSASPSVTLAKMIFSAKHDSAGLLLREQASRTVEEPLRPSLWIASYRWEAGPSPSPMETVKP
jgi:hypothetical protein